MARAPRRSHRMTCRAEAERRAELASKAMGDVKLAALSDWQAAWLDQLVARDEWTRHLQEAAWAVRAGH